LDVSGSISVRGTNVISTGADIFGGLNYDIYGNIRVLRSTSAQADGMYIGYGGAGGPLRFFSNSGTTEFMTIATSGNVGIGITGPSHKLHVYGADIRQMIQSSADNSNIIIGQWDGSTNRIESSVRKLFLTSYANGIGFGINGSENMTLNTSGNLGIGTTSPGAPLTIYRASDPHMRINGGGNYSYIQMDDGTSNGYLIKNVSAGTGNGALAGALYTYTDSNKAFQHIHSGTPLFTILSGGNVGIGTTSPIAKLEAYGGSMDPTLTPGDPSIFSVNSLGVQLAVGRMVTSPFSVWLQGKHATVGGGLTYPIVLNPLGGFVGIGTTSPGTLLQVHGSNPFFRISNSASSDQGIKITYGNSDTHGLHLLYNASSALSYIDNTYPIDAAQVWGDILFRQNVASTMTTRMIIKANSGNVGIGTTGPSARLHVFDTNNSPATGNLLVTSTGGNASIRIDSNSTANYTYFTLSQGGVGKFELGIVPTTSDLYINPTVQSGPNGAAIYIKKADGNVGIGLTSPGYKLDVNGTFNATGTSTLAAVSISGTINSSATEAIRINNNSGYISIYNTAGTTRTGYIQGLTANSLTIAAENSSILQFNVGGSERVRIDTAGNVGIGTTTGTFTLNVYNNADVWHARFGSATGEVRIGGQTSSGAVIQAFVPGSGTVRDLYLQRDGGNIGVGLNNPSVKVHIYENANRVTYITQNNNHTARFEAYGTATAIDTTASNGIFFRINGGDIVKFAADGNVGIGTSLPGKKLDVEGIVRTRGASGTGGFEIGAATTGAAKWRIEWDSASDSLDFNWVG
jgi:hypothetical protein